MTPAQVNAWRIIPRLAVVIFLYLLIECNWWFFALAEPNTAQSVGFSAVWGAAAAFFKFYMETGNKN